PRRNLASHPETEQVDEIARFRAAARTAKSGLADIDGQRDAASDRLDGFRNLARNSKTSPEIAAGAERQDSQSGAGTDRLLVLEEAVGHFINSAVPAGRDDRIETLRQQFPCDLDGVAGTLGETRFDGPQARLERRRDLRPPARRPAARRARIDDNGRLHVFLIRRRTSSTVSRSVSIGSRA